jgi:hypothetical protein
MIVDRYATIGRVLRSNDLGAETAVLKQPFCLLV